jgi:hypothetical protein
MYVFAGKEMFAGVKSRVVGERRGEGVSGEQYVAQAHADLWNEDNQSLKPCSQYLFN